jgi:hypothetical protein
MTDENKKPVHKISVGSGILATIWENSTSNGVLHAVEVERRYRDKESEEWKTSTSYVGTQVLLASKAYEMAFEYIQNLRAS